MIPTSTGGSAIRPERGTHGLVVPDNRWDMVAADVAEARTGPLRYAVVITYYEQQRQLAALYAALAAQRISAEVVVVDDGSRNPPRPAPGALRVTVVRQADLGFRAASARNRGARATNADVLLFLDADTIPTPGCLDALAAWPTVLDDALVVGRRRHADLAALDDDAVQHWAAGGGDPPIELPGPSWLEHGYRHSADLLHADDRSYRFVISALMACRRELFDDIGGFDVTLREYGGEDWDFAARAFNNGAVLVHEPAAAAWHDGPDWSERVGDTAARNGQTIRLADRIPDTAGRAPGVIHRWPQTVVVVTGTDEGSAITAAVLSVLDELVDVHVYLPDCEHTPSMFATDSRVHVGLPHEDVALRARTLVRMQPVIWRHGALRRALDVVRPDSSGRLTVNDGPDRLVEIIASRARGRLRRHPNHDHGALARWFGDITIDAATAGVDIPTRHVDLAGLLDRRSR